MFPGCWGNGYRTVWWVTCEVWWMLEFGVNVCGLYWLVVRYFIEKNGTNCHMGFSSVSQMCNFSYFCKCHWASIWNVLQFIYCSICWPMSHVTCFMKYLIFLWLFHLFHFAEKPIIGCLLVGSFVMNYPVCDSMTCYMCLLALKAIYFSSSYFSLL